MTDRSLPPRKWPPPSIDMLLKACLLPDEKAARQAWQTWIGSHDFDAITHHELRVLAALSARIGRLDPASPYRPRMEGVARSQWTHTQLVLSGGVGAIGLLTAAGIPSLVFKGAAQYAEGLATERRRIMGDLDLLVPREALVRAVALLTDDGWSGSKGESAAYLCAVADVRVGMNLVKGRHGDLDLHRTLFHFSRFDRQAEAVLWSTAGSGALHGQPVTVAAPEVNVIVSLVHAIESPGGDWAIDVATRMRRQALDWSRLVDLATRWRVAGPVRIGLGYLAEDLHQPVPPAVLGDLAAVRDTPAERLQFWSRTRTRARHQPLARQLVRQATRRWLLAQGYVGAQSDRTRVAIVSPVRVTAAPAGDAAAPLAASASVSAEAGPLRLTIETTRPERRRALRFDVTAGERLIGHVRARVGPGEGRARFAVMLDVPADAAGELTVTAWPLRRGGEGDEAGGPLPFRLMETRAVQGAPAAAHRALRLLRVRPRG